MGKLTSRVFASGASLNDLIHVVLTGDTSQSPSGSSYKAPIQGYANIIKNSVPYVTGGTNLNGTTTFTNNTGGTFTVTGYSTVNFDTYVTGGTYATGIATFTNNTGGTFNVTGFSTGSTDTFVTGGTYSIGTATFVNNTGGTFNVSGFFTGGTDIFVTGGTYTDGTATFRNNTGGTFTVTGFNTGSGTVNYLAKWASSSDLTDSQIIDNGSNVLIGTDVDNLSDKLQVNGTSFFNGRSYVNGTSFVNGNLIVVPNEFEGFRLSVKTESLGISLNSEDSSILPAIMFYTASEHKFGSGGLPILEIDASNRLIFSGTRVLLSTSDDGDSKLQIGGSLRIDNILGGGPSINNLGIDATGRVVVGTSGSSGTEIFVTGGTYTAGTTTFRNNTGGTFTVTGYTNPLKYYAEPTATPTSPIVAGSNSIAIGNNAQANSNDMLVFGTNAGNNTTGSNYSVYIGLSAGQNASSTNNSSFIGNGAGQNATNSNNSVFINAGNSASGSSETVMIGFNAGYKASSASSSIFIGRNSAYEAKNSTGSQFIGHMAAYQSSGLTLSTVIGEAAGYQTRNYNGLIAIGNASGYQVTGGSFSVSIGDNASRITNSLGSSNVIGKDAAYSSSTLQFVNAIGYRAAWTSSQMSDTNFIGSDAGYNGYFYQNSNIIGKSAAYSSNTVSGSNVIGNQAGYKIKSVDTSNIIGNSAGFNGLNYTGVNIIGASAGNGSFGVSNTNIIGINAGFGSSSLQSSNFIGNSAGSTLSGANYSNFIGSGAGDSASNSIQSNFFGLNAGQRAINSSNSNFIGRTAGYQASASSYSNLIGYNAGANVGVGNVIGNNNIIIGTNITVPNASINKINIGGLIFGHGTYSNTGSNPSTAASGGRVGINKDSDDGVNTLQIGGTLNIGNITGGGPSVNNLGIDATGRVVIGTSGGGGGVSGSGTINFIPKWSTTTNLSNSLLFDDGTNVGIGTTSPVSKLTIDGPSNTNVLTILNNDPSDGSYSSIRVNHTAVSNLDTEIRFIKDTFDGSFIAFMGKDGFDSEFKQNMRITSSGSVSIGAPDFGYLFSHGGVIIGNNGYRINPYQQGVDVAPYYDLLTGYDNSVGPCGIFLGNELASGNASTHIKFSVYGPGFGNMPVDAMFIKSNGHVLIGTDVDNLSDNLQVNGSINASGMLRSNSAVITGNLYVIVPDVSTNYQLYVNKSVTGGIELVSFDTDFNYKNFTLIGSDFIFNVGANPVTIDSEGTLKATTTNTLGFTVSTLPVGTIGMRAYVTDASAPTFGSAVVGGGAVVIPVFYDGTTWIVG